MSLVLLNVADLSADSDKNPTNYVYLDTSTQEIVYVSSNNFTELFRMGGGAGKPDVFTVALNTADFADAAHQAMLIGQRVAASNYNGTGTGIVAEKVSLTLGNVDDWRVVATESVADTNGIGEIPA